MLDNLPIDVWVDDRKLGVAQPSLCLFHKSPAIGGQFLEALAELKQNGCPGKRTLTFAPSSRKKAIGKLTLSFVAASDDLKVMNVQCQRDTATIRFTSDGLALLVAAFTSWLGGAEDFGVSPRHSPLDARQLGKLDLESGEVWFWGPGYVAP